MRIRSRIEQTHGYEIKGRLKPGTSQAAARTELSALWNALQQQYPDANRDRTIVVRTELQQRLRSQPSVAVQVGIMTALAAVVLIIACANVANLMLGRARCVREKSPFGWLWVSAG